MELLQISSTPATRLDVINLQEMLDTRLQQRQARETGICPVRRQLYTQCFDELIRQVCFSRVLSQFRLSWLIDRRKNLSGDEPIQHGYLIIKLILNLGQVLSQQPFAAARYTQYHIGRYSVLLLINIRPPDCRACCLLVQERLPSILRSSAETAGEIYLPNQLFNRYTQIFKQVLCQNLFFCS